MLQESPEIKSRKRRFTNIQAFTDKLGIKTKAQKEQSRVQRTVLLTKEISEDSEYMPNLEIPLLAKFDQEQAQAAYKILVRALRPVYSGSTDHRINMLDAKKVLPILSLENFNQSKLKS